MGAARRDIDNTRSMVTIHVSRSGLLSAFGHDHEIATRISRGYIEYPENPSVELWIDARGLRVMDSDSSAKDRTEVQKTMEGPEVLDVHGFPEIHFRSTAASRQSGGNRWSVRGQLDLHGQSRPVVLEVSETDGSFQGTATLKMRDYGINPPAAAGGSVKVKDEIRLDFKVATAQLSSLLSNRSATPARPRGDFQTVLTRQRLAAGLATQSSARSGLGD
jgi:hypothetical protein